MDLTLISLVALMAAAWFAAGFAFCTARHRQRGLEVDPVRYVIPELDPTAVH